MVEENDVAHKTEQFSKGVSVLLVIAISLIVSFLVHFLSHFFIFPLLETKYTYVRVPDVRNLSLAEAKRKLQSVQLKYHIVEEVESETSPAGNVVFQQPLPKTLVKKNSEVMLIVSRGIPVVKVPQVSLKPVEEAKKIIMQAGLVVGEVKEEYSDSVEKGLVITTDPPENSEVNKGSKVVLITSLGKQIVLRKVSVPNLIGKSLVEAKKILESRGLRLGNIKKVCDEEKEFDIIISQSPQAGRMVEQGSKVDVIYNAEAE